MSKYHKRTLELLGPEGELEPKPVPQLEQWARENNVALPAAYLEWAQLDRANLLQKYSNDDWFGLETPDLIVTPDGTRGLLFNSENQDNFQRIAVLDQGDDPPVWYAWIGEPPWMTYADRFSDCVYAQIFDWQYLLEFDADNPGSKEIAYYGDIKLKNDKCLDLMRRRFPEVVTTKYLVEADLFTEYRFLRSPRERIKIDVDNTRAASIQITGEKELVPRLEAELLECFADDVIPCGFNSIRWAADFLGSRLDNGWWTQLRHACLEKPSAGAMDRLAECHRARSLRARMDRDDFPHDGEYFAVGGEEWGIRLTFLKCRDGWWQIDNIREVAE